MEILVYRHCEILSDDSVERTDAQTEYWRPSIARLTPVGKRRKYVAYSVFHWLRIFRNRDYGELSVTKGDKRKASMLVVPAYFKWPFMRENDVQFTYVVTDPFSRQEGWGTYLVQQGLKRFLQQDRQIWYVTDTNNVASQRLAEKAGFSLVGKARPRTSRFRRVRLITTNEPSN